MRRARVHFFESPHDHRFYWTVKSANGEPVARCSENGYPSSWAAKRGFVSAALATAVAYARFIAMGTR